MITKLMGYRQVNSLEYLGLSLMMRKRVVADFGKLIKSAQEKTNLWGKRRLSYAGRALLIKTCLLTGPMYLVTHTMIPQGVLNSIEKMARRFLWQKDANSRGMHYVAWKDLCQPKTHGGLGFYSLVMGQGVLRARLAWDVIQNSRSLLHKLLKAKYGMDIWGYTPGKNVSVTWKVIQDGAKALRPILRWKIGNGQMTDVVQDTWILDRSIAQWPTFVNINAVDNVKVSFLLDNLLQWDSEVLEDCFGDIMMRRIQNIKTNCGDGEDCPELTYSRSSMTVTEMAFRAMVGEGEYQFLWLDKLKLHPREKFFWWRLLRKAIPTCSWLFSRGLSDSPLCPWGCNMDEDVDHCSSQCVKLIKVFEILGKWRRDTTQFEVVTMMEDQEMWRKASKLNATLVCIATWCRQRAKTKWIEEGDVNSHFFHSFASARRRGNKILEVHNSNGVPEVFYAQMEGEAGCSEKLAEL